MPVYFTRVTPQELATNKNITSLQCLKLISHPKLMINPAIKITVELKLFSLSFACFSQVENDWLN